MLFKGYQSFEIVLSCLFSPEVCQGNTFHERECADDAALRASGPSGSCSSCWAEVPPQAHQGCFPGCRCAWRRKVHFHVWLFVWTFDSNAGWAGPNGFVSIFILYQNKYQDIFSSVLKTVPLINSWNFTIWAYFDLQVCCHWFFSLYLLILLNFQLCIISAFPILGVSVSPGSALRDSYSCHSNRWSWWP